MDGTLLNESSVITERTASAIRRAQDAGVRVVIATGRPVWWLGPLIDIGFDGIAVCMNGAVVYDIAAQQVVSSSLLLPEPMQRFLLDLERREPRFALAVERLGTELSACWAEPEYEHPWSEGLFQRGPRSALISEPVAKLLVRGFQGSADLAGHARAAAGSTVTVTYSTDDGLIEVSAPGVNKGSTLQRLAAAWGIERSQVIAFGDMPNDLEMLAWAGHGVAMGNGHTEVQAVADEVIGMHHHDAVAEVLERWF